MSKPVHVVTGANSGIGLAMARELARGGAHVAIICRNRERGEVARVEIGDAALFVADLSLMSGVRRVAGELSASYPRIDVLVNNAGVFLHSRQVTAEGLETMLAVNHLAPYVLTRLLIDRLEGGRVVGVSSVAHRGARLDVDDLGMQRRFDAMRQYCNTKLMNILFTTELARRVAERGIVANCFHPGAVASGFAQDDAGWFGALVRLGKPFLKSPARAARTGVQLATAPELGAATGGYYVGKRLRSPTRAARDRELAARLWAASAKLSGPLSEDSAAP